MTCIKKRLRIAYENIAFYGNKTWINDCIHYTRMNQELYARECKIQESEWTELVVRHPRTVQDVIPNSKLALYHNCEYNQSRELSYRPTLSFDITFHYPCLHRNSAYNEPWMLPEVEELFMMHTCVDTFNFLCYKRLEDLPNLDFIDAQHNDDFCCQLEIEEGFHEITPMLEDMFDKTPGQPCSPFDDNDRSEVVIPPLYKVATLDEMLMKMKLRFGNIRQIWSVSKGGTCPDRAMRVFKSPFKSSFVREKHQFDVRGIEMFSIFAHGRDAKRLRNLREIRSIQKLAEAIKDFKKSLKQIRHHQKCTNQQLYQNNTSSQATSAPSLASEEATGQETAETASSTPTTTRRLYSDVVQGLGNSIHNRTTSPSIKSDYYSNECTSSTPTTSSSARESYISICSSSSSASPLQSTAITLAPTVTSPNTWTIPPSDVSSQHTVEELRHNSSLHSIASSSCRTQASSMVSICSSDASSSAITGNPSGFGVNLLHIQKPDGGGVVENSSSSFQNGVASSPQQKCDGFSNSKPQQYQQPSTSFPQQVHQPQHFSTYFYSNTYPSTSHNSMIGFLPTTNFYHQNTAGNYYAAPPQQATFRPNQQTPAPIAVAQQQQGQIQTRTYQNQQQQQAVSNASWLLTSSHSQYSQQNALKTNSHYALNSLPQPYLVMTPQGAVVKAATATVASAVGTNQRWSPSPVSQPQQQQYNPRPSISIPGPPMQQQQQQPIYHTPQNATMWQQGLYNRAITGSPQQQQMIMEDLRRQNKVQQSVLPRVTSNTTILTRPSCSKMQPTSILVKPTAALVSSADHQQRRATGASRQQEDGCVFSRGGGIVMTSRSDDLERQALEEYQLPSNEMLLKEIERQAEEQYDSSPENWLSPPSNGDNIHFAVDMETVPARGALGTVGSSILIA